MCSCHRVGIGDDGPAAGIDPAVVSGVYATALPTRCPASGNASAVRGNLTPWFFSRAVMPSL